MTAEKLFDTAFDSTLLGNRQAIVTNKHHIGEGIYHVCILDVNGYFSEGWHKLTKGEDGWHISGLSERPGRTDETV